MSQESNKIEIEDQLKQFMRLHRLEYIEDVLNIAPADLLKMDGFGYRLLNYLFNKNTTKD